MGRGVRAAAQVAVWAGIGGMVSVAVAWGCALWSSVGMAPTAMTGNVWPIEMPEDWGSPTAVTALRGFGVDRTVWHAMGGATPGRPWLGVRPSGTVTVVRAGWPMRSLRAVVVREGLAGRERPAFAPPAWMEGIAVDRLPVWTLVRGKHELPVVPEWRGMIVNGLVFGAGAWCVWFGVAGRRAWRRGAWVRRGLCPGCGYALGEGPRCPECGWRRE